MEVATSRTEYRWKQVAPLAPSLITGNITIFL